MTTVARDLMTGDILRARADWTVGELTDFFARSSISGAPVVDDGGRLIGVVSLTDVARSSANSRKQRAPRSHDYYTLGPAYFAASDLGARRPAPTLTVRDIMTPQVFDVPVDATVAEVADVMVKGRIHRVFVTQDDMVIGIISSLDLLRVLL